MEYSAYVFVFVLLGGLIWLFVYDMVWGKPIHVVSGYNGGVDVHCGTHEPHTRIDSCDRGMHDHDLDGIPDDRRNSHFHEQDPAHHHQTGNIMSHPAEFDARHSHHRNQINPNDVCGYGNPHYK